MKKLLAVGLATVFMAASGMAFADSTTACTGKKCHGHGHKKGAKSTKAPSGSTGPSNGTAVPSK